MRAARAERRWVIGFAGVVMVVTTIPYLVGFQMARANPQWQYSGLLFGAEDGYSYLAKMLWGAAGAWFFRSPYTAYPSGGMLAFLPYLLLGKLTAPPGQYEQLVALFHLFRVAAGLAMVLAVYDFLALFIQDVNLRRWGTALATLGGGLGWLALLGLEGLWSGTLPGMEQPLEFYSPETFGFLMLLGLPHLAAARALLLWSLTGYLKPPASLGRWAGWLPGVLCLGVGIMQPLTVVVEWAVVGLHLAAAGAWQFWAGRRKAADWQMWWGYVRRAARIVLISAPVVVYTFLALRLDPTLAGWEGQNRIVSPPVHHYLLAYGLLLPLAAAGVGPAIRANGWHGWLIAAWAAAFPLLAYAPYTLQRRMPEAVWVALSALAFIWLETRGKQALGRARAFLGVFYLSTLVLYLASLYGVTAMRPPLYRSRDEVKGFEFLAQNARKNDVVLASFETSTALPAWAPVRVLLGSGPESVNASEIETRVQCFYEANCPEKARAALLREFGVDFVVWGPAERKLGDWDPREAGALQPVYEQGEMVILKVEPQINTDGHR